MTTDLESLKRDAGRLARTLRAMKRCDGVHLTDQKTGETFATLIDKALAAHATQPDASPAEAGDGEWPHDLGKIIEDCRERFGTPYADSVLNDLIHRVGSVRTTPLAPPREASPVGRDEGPHFKNVSPGEYDDTMQCTRCGFQFMESADATMDENKRRSVHACKSTPTPDAAPSVRDSEDDERLRTVWREAGGSFHGPNVETATITEENLFAYMRRVYGVITGMLVAASPAVPSTQTEIALYQRRHRNAFSPWETCSKEEYEHTVATGNMGVIGDVCETRMLYAHPTLASTSPAVSVDEVRRIVERQRREWMEPYDAHVTATARGVCDDILADLDNLSGSAK